MLRVELLAPRVRNLYSGGQHGRIFPLVHLVHPLLAIGSAGDCALPHRLAHHAAVPHLRHRGTRRICVACSAVFAASTGSAWPARDLKKPIPRRGSNLEVRRTRSSIFGEKRRLCLQTLTFRLPCHAVEISVGNWKSCKM